jgi:hypothetical protein
MPEIPNKEWYQSVSDKMELLHKCPYTNIYFCPRFWQSLLKLSEDMLPQSDEEKEKTERYHQEIIPDIYNSFAPPKITRRPSTDADTPPPISSIYGACPEVSGRLPERLYFYAIEYDLDSSDNIYTSIDPMHYSECDIFQRLSEMDQEIFKHPRMENILPFTHSPNYRTVYLNGTEYRLSDKQAEIVQTLHKAHKRGIRKLTAVEIFPDAITDVKMKEKFKNSSAWGTLVQHGNRRYWLNY